MIPCESIFTTGTVMTNWQVTAKTIYCNSVNSEVTIIVNKDWSVQCTGFDTFREGEKKYKACRGLDCRDITDYRTQLQQEEKS